MKKGQFITFEGGEGAGKTTVMRAIADEYNKQGYPVLCTREPGGIEIAEQVRTILLDPKYTQMDGRTEALLYAACRRQHLVEKIIPSLEKGYIVFCDRFIDSSLAYQGWARGIGMNEIMEINRFAIEQWMPDLTLFFDIHPKLGMQRIQQNRGREVNRLDQEKLNFHLKVYEGYQKILMEEPNRMIRIDASPPIEEVIIEIKKIFLGKGVI